MLGISKRIILYLVLIMPYGIGILNCGENTSLYGTFDRDYKLCSGYVELNFPNRAYLGNFDASTGLACGLGQIINESGLSFFGHFNDGILDGIVDVCTPMGDHMRCVFNRGELVDTTSEDNANLDSSDDEYEYFTHADSTNLPHSLQGCSPRHDEEAKHWNLNYVDEF